MITLDQVQKLEKKVNDAVELINRLKSEKVVLEEKNRTVRNEDS
jgi:FtsZ-binding cell division protein ZapB